MPDLNKIANKWQKRWDQHKLFQVKENSKKKFYVLEMFPYPSGSGLHMGHAFNYTIGDIYARFKRMNGFNVLYPMGYDSFGLPAENAAIKAKSHPKKFTEDAIKNYVKQQKELGLSYDWSRMVETHKPDFYKWDQWIFLKMYEKGLAYKKTAPVNWCSKCNTVLANEQVTNGKCWRHEDTNVEVKKLDQWFFKITKYADELYENLKNLNDWPDLIKKLQKNWIGKSHGTEIKFKVNNEEWPIFTTRPDTFFGVTFMVVSAQHPKLMDLVTKEQKNQVEKFLSKIHTVSQEEIDKSEKEGVFTGSYAMHPLTNEKIPIYAGNFVLAEYGSGMVMAVPAHDQRDFDFAKKYKIPIKQVVSSGNNELNQAFKGNGKLINSEKFNGLDNQEAKEKITEYLKSKKLGKKTINFRLKDWLISRQRFWGTPIPIINCNSCGPIPVPEKDLPVVLPSNIKFGKSKNPLTETKSFLEVRCPKCKKPSKRETDTMDTFVNSSWYFLRYTDPKNNKQIFDKKKVNYWNPVDLYIGGKEHACLHLIYFRFYTKFLRDLGLLNFDEPCLKLYNQGMLHGEGGEKMSKSKGNVILPEVVSKAHGIDSARFFLVSLATPDKDRDWNEKGIEGSSKFLKKVYNYVNDIKISKSSPRTEHKINNTIKDITLDIENLRYDQACIKIRNLFDSLEESISKKDIENVILLLSPFTPHLAEELWEKIGNKPFASTQKWPKYDEKKINPKFEKEEQATDKIVSDIVNIIGLLKKEIKKVYIYAIPNEIEFYNTEDIKKRVNKEIIVYKVNDKDKYDPEDKSKKAKPGKPAIYLE